MPLRSGLRCTRAPDADLARSAAQVVPTAAKDTLYDYSRANGAASARREWQVYLQAGAGIVADSVRWALRKPARRQACVSAQSSVSKGLFAWAHTGSVFGVSRTTVCCARHAWQMAMGRAAVLARRACSRT